MILCIGVLCVAVLVPVVGRKKVSSEVRRAAVVMILVSALAILAQISEEMESGGIELELVRPSYGEGDYEEEMTVDAEGILDGYSYQVVVPERILSKQEEQKLLEAAQQEIDDEFVKNNGEVREKAEIRKNYQEGAVSADWEFEPYDVVDDEGRVVEENIPENGILVKAAVTLRCESSECISERYFRVMPKELDEEHKMIREIENYLKKQSADPGDSIKLPEQLNGKKLIWNTKKEHLSEKILFLGGGIVIILPFVEQSRKKEREKKRKALLELQYADMVSNLVLLLGAGMTVSKAWNRLTENYMNERQKRTICRKEVYEEMQRTSFEIKNLKALASEDDGKVYNVQNSKLTNRALLYTTGAYSLNCIKEIYDLAGNLGEFVIDSENDLAAVAGGDYKSFTGSQSINTLNYVEKNKAYANVGFRFSLYVIE